MRTGQRVVYLSALLSGRYKMPLHLLEYDASQGVDAIALLREPDLVSPRAAHVRVEFKLEVSAQHSIKHSFEAIDALVCWRVGRTGQLYEHDSNGLVGALGRRKKPVAASAMDTHEVVYDAGGGAMRTLPVPHLSAHLPKGKRGG